MYQPKSLGYRSDTMTKLLWEPIAQLGAAHEVRNNFPFLSTAKDIYVEICVNTARVQGVQVSIRHLRTIGKNSV